MKKALITGISGQDGSYLAELLLSKDYEVHGIVRTSSHKNPMDNISDIKDSLILHIGNLCDYNSILNILKEVQPDEIYHLGASTHVGESFKIPQEVISTNALGSFNIFEAARTISPFSKIYNACTSEMFGSAVSTPDSYDHFHPDSPYACAKVFAFHQAVNYREAYKMFICNGILCNHESPRRGEDFVTRKITKAIARIKAGTQSKLKLGNIDTWRDWGFAGDYVYAMWQMLQHEKADDYIVCTGELHSLKELLEVAFKYVDLNWEEYVEYDTSLIRPKDNKHSMHSYEKIKKVLGWEPTVNFEQLVVLMLKNDLKLVGIN